MPKKESGPDYVEFTPPKEFMVPEGIQMGKPFDLVCTFEAKEDGQICMTKLGNTPMPKREGEEETKPDYSQYSRGLIGADSEGGAAPPAAPPAY